MSVLTRALHQYGALVFEPGTVPAHLFTEFLSTFGGASLQRPEDSADIQRNQGKPRRFEQQKCRAQLPVAHRPSLPSEPPELYLSLWQGVPGFGGDTLFNNATAAYERLDQKFAEYLETLVAVHSWDATGHLDERFPDPEEAARQRV